MNVLPRFRNHVDNIILLSSWEVDYRQYRIDIEYIDSYIVL